MAVRIFPTAQDARQYGSRNLRVIHAEVRHLESKMMDAMEAQKLKVSVSDSPFCVGGLGIDTVLYWRVSQEQTDDSLVQYHLDTVQSYFTDQGYVITAKTNPDTGRTIAWEIQW